MSKKTPQIVKDWAKSIEDRSPNQQIKFYSKDSILLATFEYMCVGKKEMFDYFVEFLDKKNLKCRILENITIVDVDKDSIVANGLYEFSFLDENNKEKNVLARYTFVINNGYIITQHSSLNP